MNSLSPDIIDRIVANVMSQLSATPAPPHPPAAPRDENRAAQVEGSIGIVSAVVTADVLEEIEAGKLVSVRPKAVITPAAWDVIRSRKLRIERTAGVSQQAAPGESGSNRQSPHSHRASLLIVVKNSRAVDQVWEEISGTSRRELLGCVDDAARLAISEISRGEVGSAIILAEQTHRAACLSNRNAQVKAVAVREIADVRAVHQQLRANVWCFDPSGRSYFEVRNLLRQIEAGQKK